LGWVDMGNTRSTAEEAAPKSEITRLGGLFSWQSILFVILCTSGLGLGVVYIFGLTWGGKPLLEGQYYWLFIGIFTAASFIALPAFSGQQKVPIYDLVAAFLALAISFFFFTHAWDIGRVGWTNIPLGIVIWLLMLETARRSGGLPFLFV